MRTGSIHMFRMCLRLGFPFHVGKKTAAKHLQHCLWIREIYHIKWEMIGYIFKGLYEEMLDYLAAVLMFDYIEAGNTLL